MTAYVLIYSDPQAEIFDTKEEALERAQELVEEGNDVETMHILKVTKSWEVKASDVQVGDEEDVDGNLF
jgi:hypothetical protein